MSVDSSLAHSSAAPSSAALGAAAQWESIRTGMREKIGEATFQSWLQPLAIYQAEASQITLAAPTRFLREWVLTHYHAEMLRIWQQKAPHIQRIDIIVRPAKAMAIEQAAMRHMAALPANENPVTLPSAPSQESIEQVSAPLDPRFTFERYVTGKPNELAFAAAGRVATTAGVTSGCNPLFLHSGVGLGKTHLMHAIAWQIRKQNPERKVMILSAEKFMYQFIRALRSKESMAFKELFRSVDVLMIDDVQFISGKDSTQEEFFHTFNALVDQNKQLVISCDRAPTDLEGIEERVRSRLGGGLVVDIHPTSFELRLAILRAKLELVPNVMVPETVVELLARKITSNVRELEGALNRIIAHATLVGRAVTLDSAQELLADLLRASDRRITIEDIQKLVSAHFNIKLADMHSARRSRMVARPRQIAMFLAKRLTTKSLPDIGRKFGGKDHTTVMHAVKRIDQLCADDAQFADEVRLLTRLVQVG